MVFVAATPLTAQIGGTWKGTGTGNCPNPFPTPPESILPWRIWKGEIPDDEGIFKGTWKDPLGSHGTFKGKAMLGTPEEVVFVGTWSAIYDDPSGLSQIIEMGTFRMTFHREELTCHGRWRSYYGAIFNGTMEGGMVN
jgi:hypothetical protein